MTGKLSVADFMKSNPPLGKHSRLEPYLDDIRTLRDSHYSVEQMRGWLKENKVEVSASTIRAFISSRLKAAEPVGTD